MSEVFDVVIVGAGVSGIAAAHYLLRESAGSATPLRLAIFEKGAGVGGTWLANTYPGAACDVPSHWYSFSFALNPGWTRRFSDQAEIKAYLEGVVAREGLLPLISFGTAVDSTVWSEEAREYVLTLRDCSSGGGSEGTRVVRTRFVVAGPGALSAPCTPDLPSAGAFAGRAWHSARWDHSVSLEGKRVGIIGTGCSAAQIVPAIAGKVGQLVVFQRTPSWLSPRGDHGYAAFFRFAFAFIPGVMWLYRMTLLLLHDLRYFAFVRPLFPALKAYATKLANRHRERQVPNAALREALTPKYPMGCKRVIVSDDFYPALALPNVTLETAPIVRCTEGGIVVAPTGTSYPPAAPAAPAERKYDLDILVYATGFDIVASMDSINVTGRGGATMRAAFAAGGGGEAYLGVCSPGFPNMFFMMGPNTGLGHSSMITMIEAQARYAAECICGALRRGVAAVEVKQDVCDAYNKTLQAELLKNVWSNCTSWYNLQGAVSTCPYSFFLRASFRPASRLTFSRHSSLTKSLPPGQKNVVLWPFTTIRYHWELSRVLWEHYTCSK
jgi:cation diffusion facilitator CzcD-associated flavoprotein CzcO